MKHCTMADASPARTNQCGSAAPSFHEPGQAVQISLLNKHLALRAETGSHRRHSKEFNVRCHLLLLDTLLNSATTDTGEAERSCDNSHQDSHREGVEYLLVI